jgi:hypothetical protein
MSYQNVRNFTLFGQWILDTKERVVEVQDLDSRHQRKLGVLDLLRRGEHAHLDVEYRVLWDMYVDHRALWDIYMQ